MTKPASHPEKIMMIRSGYLPQIGSIASAFPRKEQILTLGCFLFHALSLLYFAHSTLACTKYKLVRVSVCPSFTISTFILVYEHS